MTTNVSIGAYAIRRSEPDQPLLADSEHTLYKVIALNWIAAWDGADSSAASTIRAALLEERWLDAVLAWMTATDEVVDIYPYGLKVHESRDYPDEEFGLRVQTKPLFREDRAAH